jgi:hypothetical protein
VPGSLPTGNVASAAIAKWRPDGPFHGVYAGYWRSTIADINGRTYLWSSTASSERYAKNIAFGDDDSPLSGSNWFGTYDYGHSDGFAVRCVVGD